MKHYVVFDIRYQKKGKFVGKTDVSDESGEHQEYFEVQLALDSDLSGGCVDLECHLVTEADLCDLEPSDFVSNGACLGELVDFDHAQSAFVDVEDTVSSFFFLDRLSNADHYEWLAVCDVQRRFHQLKLLCIHQSEQE